MRTPFQLAVIGLLLAGPVLLFAGIGGWTLWETGRLFWWSWSIPVCWGVAWLLVRWWGKPLRAPPPELDQTHWTARDEAAAEIIRQEQQRAAEIAPERLGDLQFYQQATQELALKIARHYHPKAADPLGNLTVLEILAATQLVAEDLESWLVQYVPGSHLVTVAQWRMLSQAPKWWRAAVNAGWIASILMNPANLGRYFVSKFAVDPLSKELQSGLLVSFYMLYLRQVGYYLIEMNSGRLRGGARQYRGVLRRLEPRRESAAVESNGHESAAVGVSIAIIGQVKAGKSSLVNCLLGGKQARVDVLPSTRSVQRYRFEALHGAAEDAFLTLLDTPGYGEAGASPEQFADTLDAVRQADLILLVLDARSPAKRADAQVADELRAWFRDKPQFKFPPMIGVVSKIDLLSPVLEWEPPYDWHRPRRPKEESIAGAVHYVREVFGDELDAVVPVCTDCARGRAYGIHESLMPAMAALLSEARAVSLVKTLHAELERDKFRRVLDQAVNAGRELIERWRSGGGR
jgi:predicted GTPase